MSTTREHMGIPWWNKVVIYWHENHVTVSFHSPMALPADTRDPQAFYHTFQAILESLHIDHLNDFLNMRGFNLKPLQLETDLPRATTPQRTVPARRKATGVCGMVYDALGEIEATLGAEFAILERGDASQPARGKHANLYTLHDKFFFPAPAGGTTVIAFFSLERVKSMYAMSSMTMAGNDADLTREVVDLINENLDTLKQSGGIPIVAAMPHWLNGGAPYIGGCGTHGCPVIPPIPVHNAHPLYKLEWEDLPAVRHLDGEGVTVFVLDTLPALEQIERAAVQAGPQGNHLLSMLAEQAHSTQAPLVRFHHWELPEALEKESETQPVTGRDIYGRLIGFDMPDHGLFVSGIVRELAPRANIECIRVLNNRAVGNTATLVAALQWIVVRMLWGDLRERQVVVNLSLVTTAAQEELPLVWFGQDFGCPSMELSDTMRSTLLLRANLHRVVQSLVSLGAVLVAAAGNDSNVHRWNAPPMYGMKQSPRWGPRYPAAFPEVIAVGAVDRHGQATPYSNYPSQFPSYNGIATYGGGLPTPVPPAPGECMTQARDIDGIVGVYSAASYPALAAEDCEMEYPAPPDSHGWASWVGTSFATPIVSALAALLLPGVQASGLPRHLWAPQVQWGITTAAGQQELLGRALDVQPEYEVSLLRVRQTSSDQPAEALAHAGGREV